MPESQFYLILKSKKEYRAKPIFFNYDFVKESCTGSVAFESLQFCYTDCNEEELLFKCKHRALSFDFETSNKREYFVSDRFISALENKTDYQIKKAKFVSTKGVDIAERQHHILGIGDELDAVDTKKSIIEVSKEFDFLNETKYLALNANVIGDSELFCIDNHTFIGQLFCSEKMKTKLEALAVDVLFIPVKDAAKYFIDNNLNI